jgi:hypothetical protein
VGDAVETPVVEVVGVGAAASWSSLQAPTVVAASRSAASARRGRVIPSCLPHE